MSLQKNKSFELICHVKIYKLRLCFLLKIACCRFELITLIPRNTTSPLSPREDVHDSWLTNHFCEMDN